MMVPIVLGLMLELGGHDRPASFGQKQQGQAGADVGILKRAALEPTRRDLLLLGQQYFAPLAVPIVLTDEGADS